MPVKKTGCIAPPGLTLDKLLMSGPQRLSKLSRDQTGIGLGHTLFYLWSPATRIL